MKKYFRSSTPLRAYGDGIAFEPYAIVGGSLCGSLETEDTVLIGKLEALAADPKSGVTELTEEQYASTSKKKAVLLAGSYSSTPRQVQPKVGHLKGSGAVRVETGPEPDSKVFEAASADDVVKVAKIDGEAQRSPMKKKKATENERAPSNVE